MSADNWSVCPKCQEERERDHAERVKKHKARLKKAYGNVSADEYEELLREKPEDQKPRLDEPQSVREDYEVGIVDGNGEFFVSYRAECQECGYGFRFKFSHRYKSGKATIKYGDFEERSLMIDEEHEIRGLIS